jgi:hypothetical protein
MTDKDWELARQLDDIGFVGFQQNRSKAAIKRDALRTERFIEAYKAKMKQTASADKKTGSASSKKKK